tara:strand:+ start:1178 stop:2089 length:912 start_codon:yes stop_codon:yes gene_type:complete
MKLTICICTYNRNESLKSCIKSINKLVNQSSIKINIIIIDNSKNFNVVKIKNKLINISKYKIIFLNEKKRGIVNARNKFLKSLKNVTPNFICFFDDDCIVDKYWLKNVIKTSKTFKADVITGPQVYQKNRINKNLINYSSFFEKNYNNSVCEVNWAASNNVFINYSILKNNKLLFDINLNKFGIGEDQLFFSLLKKRGNSIYWNKNVKVYEKSHFHRTNLLWLVKRSFRLGVLGHYLDKKIHGVIFGYNYNYVKSLYYLLKSFLYMLLFFNKYSRINAINFFARFIGRVSGPFVFKKIDFLKI